MPQTGSDSAKVNRYLAAVIAADAVGFSRLVEQDELRTYNSVVACRRLMRDVVSEQHGHVASTPGDFVLARFASAGEAVAAALGFVERIDERNRTAAPGERLQFRLGVGLGDVIDHDDDLVGTAVNIAARLQQVAQPSQVLASGTVYDVLHAHPDLNFTSLGQMRLKNIGEPIRVYAVAKAGAAAAAAAPPVNEGAADDRPCVQVLPFQALGEDHQSQVLANGMTVELIATLGAMSGALAVMDGGREPPNDAYVLSGALRRHDRLRISAKLARRDSGETIWSEKFDYRVEDEFDALEKIAREVAAALQVRLTEGEQAQLWLQRTESIGAWECFVRGHEIEHSMRRDRLNEAREWYRKALEKDPHYVVAIVALGFCHVDEVRLGWTDEGEAALAEAEALAARATTIEPRFADLLALRGFIAAMRGRAEEAIAHGREAVALAPRSAQMAGYLGALYRMLGQTDEAIGWYQRAIELSPRLPVWIGGNLANAHLFLGQVDEARAMFERVLARDAEYLSAHVGLAIIHARAGDKAAASAAGRRVLRIDPRFTIERWARRHAVIDPALLARLKRELTEAGLR